MNPHALAQAAEGLFKWTWVTSVQTSVLILCVFVIQIFLRKRLPAQGHYALSLLILIRLLLPAVPASPFSVSNLQRFVVTCPGQNPAISEELGLTATMPTAMPAMAERIIAGTRPERDLSLTANQLLILIWWSGVLLTLGLPIWQQARFAKWMKAQAPSRDPKLLSLLAETKALMGISKEVTLILTRQGRVPAVFGWRKPRLLLSEAAVRQLDESELRLVLSHELAHVKRDDILLNWLIILVGAWHWFNPLVWWAQRRFRADRELVCDAVVMRRLTLAERRAYGHTLIKLLESFASVPFRPGLVPMVNSKQLIRRRIAMISNYKQISRRGWVSIAALVGLICCLTFTRAADANKKVITRADAPPVDSGRFVAQEQTPGAHADKRTAAGLDSMHARLDALEARIADQQARVDRLRRELTIPSDAAEDHPDSSVGPETVRALERLRIEAVARAAQYQRLSDILTDLKSKSASELAQALPTAVPDTELTRLLGDLNQAEADYAKLGNSYGSEHPEMQALSKSIAILRKQVDQRIEGILNGLRAQVASQTATATSLSNQVAQEKVRDTEKTSAYRPYFRAKRDLEILEKVRDTLMQQLLETQYGEQPTAFQK